MNKLLSIDVGICSEYQGLLEECQSALENWNDHRAEVCNSRLVGKAAGDELLRLQAKFARAYAVLQRHTRHCPLCDLMAHMQGQDQDSESNSVSGHPNYV